MVSLAIWVGSAVFLLIVGLLAYCLLRIVAERSFGKLIDLSMKPKGGPTLADCSRMGPYRKP
jgi:hypothetical protein